MCGSVRLSPSVAIAPHFRPYPNFYSDERDRLMKSLFALVLIFVIGCATTPLTEKQRAEQEFQKAAHEVERLEKWVSYRAWCSRNGIMLWDRTFSTYRRGLRDPVPTRRDWDFHYSKRELLSIRPKWRVNFSNNVRCVDSSYLRNF